MDAKPDHARSSSSTAPFDPIDGEVRTTAQLRTVRHADDRKPMLNHYIREARVGNGQHGEVYLCYDLNNNRREVAIKAVKRHNPRAEKWSMMRRRNLPTSPHTAIADKLGTTEYKIRKEIAIMKKCRHGHVVRLLEVIDDKLREKIYMVMEYLGGGEVKWVNMYHQPIQTVDQTRRIIRDVILGLEYLHYQGIIHRDIKPANLLWTADRSMVKISDFGVSHFSYAQRLAAAGRNKEDLDNPHDPILLDDSDLSKTAGTPSFLAPEVVFDSSAEPSPVNSLANATSSSENQAQGTSTPVLRRLPITKAIDIWALGITLYCLLFGQVPFISKDGHEWSLYKVICTQEWPVPERMGFDQLETGGRYPQKRDAEGYIVVTLLNHLLQKDAKQRATLDQVKRHPWFTRDLPNPDQWLRETAPIKNDMVHVSELETNTAMSTVHFRWNWGKRLTSHLSSLLRTVRTRPTERPSIRSPGQTSNDRTANWQASQPSQVVRAKSAYSTTGRAASAGPRKGSVPRHDKGKRKADPNMTTAPGVLTGRSRSVERYSRSKGSSTITANRVAARMRRGSETLLAPSSPFHFDRSPTPQLRTTVHGDERHRKGFSLSLSAILRWRPNKFQPHGTSSLDVPSSDWPSKKSLSPTLRSTETTALTEQFCRRSEEALRYHRTVQSIASEPLTAARRASSWGENPTDFFMEEVASVNSEDPAELDHDAMILGAGGVCNDFILEPHVSSVASGSGSVDLEATVASVRQLPSERYIGHLVSSPISDAVVSAARSSGFLHHPNTTSPLTQVAYDSRSSRGDEEFDDIYSSSVDDFDEVSDGDSDDDDTDDDDDGGPIEVRRRQPMSPQFRSDGSGNESL